MSTCNPPPAWYRPNNMWLTRISVARPLAVLAVFVAIALGGAARLLLDADQPAPERADTRSSRS